MQEKAHMTGSPQRRGLTRTTAAVKSVLRRYPAEFLASLLEPKAKPHRAFRDILTELAPHDLAACWLGHGSVVVSIGDLTFVVDPVLSQRIGPSLNKRILGLSRRIPAPFGPDSLQGLDAIFITHAHFDHLDKATLRQLIDPRTTVFVPPRCSRLIPRGFADVVVLAPGESSTFRAATIEAIQPRHWGARTLLDRRRGSCAFAVRHPDGSALITGDTAFTHAFDETHGIDLAVFGIGAYNPWEHMHATPEQVWAMFQAMNARYLLPVHHSTFELSDEPMAEPMQRLEAVAAEQFDRIIKERPGELVVIPTPGEPTNADEPDHLSVK